MRIEDLVFLMGKTREEIEEMLKNTDVIELDLKETRQREIKDVVTIEVIQ